MPAGHGRWTGPLIAAELDDVDVQYVWRFLRAQKIDLAARKSWCESNDPAFAAKAAEIIGLYLDPPDGALVLAVDEKPSIQPLERAQGYLMSLISAVTARGHMRFMIKEKGGVNADVFIAFLQRLMIGSKNKIFLIVDRGPAHVAKKTKAFVADVAGALRLFYLPPYSPDRNPDELVWKHLKADTVGRASIASLADFRTKVKSSMLSLQRNPEKIRSSFQKPSLKYAAA